RQVLRVREDALDHDLGVALLAQDRRAVLRMLVERRMDLVVEVVEQRGHAPELLVLAELPCVGTDRGLDGQRMAQQRLALRVAGQRLPGAVAGDLQDARYDSPSPMTETVVASAVTESFVIEGGQPLHGRVTAAGNKNGVLPIVAACVMTAEPVLLHNVP